MLALTLLQPWASLVAYGYKFIENRQWEPRTLDLGERFAIHAARRWDPDCLPESSRFATLPGALMLHSRQLYSLSGVLGSVAFRGCVRADDEMLPWEELWFSGPIGWRLRDASALELPIPIRGGRGLWQLPPDVGERMRCQ